MVTSRYLPGSANGPPSPTAGRDLASPERRADRTVVFTVYVLSSLSHKKSYVGTTDNIERRIFEHNSGKMAYSKRYRPWKVLKNILHSPKREIEKIF